MQCPRPSSSKMPVNIPRPVRPENQREETGGVDCLTKAMAFFEDAGSPRKPSRKGENYLSPENYLPNLTAPFFLPSSSTPHWPNSRGSQKVRKPIREVHIGQPLGPYKYIDRNGAWVWRGKTKISRIGTNRVDIKVSVKHTHTPMSSSEEFTKEMFLTSSMTLNASSEQGNKKGSESEKEWGGSHEITPRALNVFPVIERQQARLSSEKNESALSSRI